MEHTDKNHDFNFDALNSLIRKSTGYGFARITLAIFIYILLTPFILHKLGKDLYGLWSLNTVISTFLLMSDFGFKNSLVHFTATNLNDSNKLNKIFNSIFFFFLFISALCIVIVFLSCDFLVADLLKIPSKYSREANFLIITTAIGFSIRLISSTYQSVVEGNQRVYYTQKVYIVWLIFNAVTTFVGLTLFPSIYAICIISVLGNILIFLMFYIDVKKKYTYAFVALNKFELRTFKSILPYSIWIQITSILILLREPLLKIIISRQYGLEELAAFEVAYRVTIQCMSFAVIPVLTALPVSSLLRGNKNALRKMMRKYLMWICLTLSLPALIIIFFSQELITLWLGKGLSDAASILPMIFTAYCIYYLTEPLYKAMQGVGRSNISAFSQGMFLSALIVALWFFVDLMGFQGIPYSLFISCLIFSVSNLFFYKKFFQTARPHII